MTSFKPTFLYIKRRAGLWYFGKTVTPDPHLYRGSGRAWKNHVMKHRYAVTETIWTELFTDPDAIREFAEFFSTFFDIVKSPLWANLKTENGLDGGSEAGFTGGWLHTDETKAKISARFAGAKKTDLQIKSAQAGRDKRTPEQKAETNRKLSEAASRRVQSEESKAKVSQTYNNKSDEEKAAIVAKRSASLKAVTYVPMACPHCGKTGRPANMKRYHFDNCKLIS